MTVASLAEQYHVSKYPTLKLFRYGRPVRAEYRGQRSVDGLVTYLTDQLNDPLHRVHDLDNLHYMHVRLSVCLFVCLQLTPCHYIVKLYRLHCTLHCPSVCLSVTLCVCVCVRACVRVCSLLFSMVEVLATWLAILTLCVCCGGCGLSVCLSVTLCGCVCVCV